MNAGYLALSAAQFNAACAAATRSACGIQADAKQLLSTCSLYERSCRYVGTHPSVGFNAWSVEMMSSVLIADISESCLMDIAPRCDCRIASSTLAQ